MSGAPGLWRVDADEPNRIVYTHANGATFGIAELFGGDEMAGANAARIVRCVNAHDELVAALRDVVYIAEVRGAPDHVALIEARALLTKVSA